MLVPFLQANDDGVNIKICHEVEVVEVTSMYLPFAVLQLVDKFFNLPHLDVLVITLDCKCFYHIVP